MRTITINLAAGERNELSVTGNFFYLTKAGSAVDVEFLMADGRQTQPLAGIDAGTWAEPGPFVRVSLYSAVAQQVKIIVAEGRAGVFRISGDVSVIDGGLSRTKGGLSFIGGSAIGGVAGQFGHVQLWNPSASGRRLVVNQLMVSADIGTGFWGAMKNAAILSFDRNCNSKMSGGADSVAEMRVESNATKIISDYMINAYVAAGTAVIPLSEPIVIEPGNGLVLVATEVGKTVWGNFQYFEEGI